MKSDRGIGRKSNSKETARIVFATRVGSRRRPEKATSCVCIPLIKRGAAVLVVQEYCTCGQKCKSFMIMVSSSAPLQLSLPASPIICSSSTTTRPMSSCLPCRIACVINTVAFSYLRAGVIGRQASQARALGQGERVGVEGLTCTHTARGE